MKYQPKLPDDGVNISKDSFLLQALKLLLSLVFLTAIAYGLLSLTLHLIIDYIPPKYEKKLVQFISLDAGFDNPRQSAYLDEVTDTIAKCAKLPYDVQSFIIPQDTPNAFALPGGTIYITRGMLKELKNQNELAAILGHEMGHFKNRDHLKGLGSSLLFSLLSLSLGEGYGNILNATLSISKIKYSQSAELSSDVFALDMMQCAYGSVSDAKGLFERLDKGENLSYFLASHPAFEKRLKKMQEYIDEKNYDTSPEAIAFKKEF